jgi:hypothetical protein
VLCAVFYTLCSFRESYDVVPAAAVTAVLVHTCVHFIVSATTCVAFSLLTLAIQRTSLAFSCLEQQCAEQQTFAACITLMTVFLSLHATMLVCARPPTTAAAAATQWRQRCCLAVATPRRQTCGVLVSLPSCCCVVRCPSSAVTLILRIRYCDVVSDVVQ